MRNTGVIRICNDDDFMAIFAVINDAALAYKGAIPDDRWKEPYMDMGEIKEELAQGVVFWGYEETGRLTGVMGIQDKGEVSLIRHAYVLESMQGKGIGTMLLEHLKKQSRKPVLIGTWADASWAVKFYEKHGYRLVTPREKDRLLKKYWSIPDRQVDTSVVLGDPQWFSSAGRQ